ncbi:fatty acid desaturase [Jatrophihabitans endophyticus]|uniref:fatty acid desaturase family protein n=1 Tax=Jatrophihabitans endophyticus TaxID=1206085 RepID=UPI0019DD46B6|nr:fatty acid desaturase [Jatrophihabitans endophyticus]MBE7188325.1 fatty acid desaturase [Jatrophihabitans endophyticus]
MTERTITLSDEQIDELGRELDAIKQRLIDDLGRDDREYIYNVIKAQRAFEVAGRASLMLSALPPFWLAGVASLSLSKILDNMEIGHNVMHGQYDWMRDPALNSKRFEWDTACPSDQWRYSHNYMHHTFTNILDQDRDIGYGILRMDESQKWNPYYLGNPLWAFLLMTFFQYGVAVHDLEAENVVTGKRSLADNLPLLKGIWKKVGRQTLKDYVLFPLLTGPQFATTLSANMTANLVRNLWAYSIIFCGHFPSGTATFTQEETENETRGEWYVRQMMGSANITGSPLFHILSGNLSHQIEHHLFPDIPARRYPQIAAEIEALCAKYDLPYNTGRFSRQIGSTWGKIFRLAVPFGGRGGSDDPAAARVDDEPAAAAA